MTPDRALPPDHIVDQAIDWMMALREGALTETERASFDAWLEADQRHRQAWTQLERSLTPFRALQGRVSGAQLVDSLETRQMSRRSALRTITGGGAATVAALTIADRYAPLADCLDNFSTRTGERHRFSLPDGSTLTLDARSRATRLPLLSSRNLRLDQGSASLSVAPSSRPFRISAGPLAAEFSSGHMLLARRAAGVRAIAIDAPARLTFNGTEIPIQAGEGYVVSKGNLMRLPSDDTLDAASWMDGRLILHNQTLGAFVEAMRPYQLGFLAITERASALRISCVCNLNDLQGSLTMLQSMFPIRVLEIGDLFRQIDVVASRV